MARIMSATSHLCSSGRSGKRKGRTVERFFLLQPSARGPYWHRALRSGAAPGRRGWKPAPCHASETAATRPSAARRHPAPTRYCRASGRAAASDPLWTGCRPGKAASAAAGCSTGACRCGHPLDGRAEISLHDRQSPGSHQGQARGSLQFAEHRAIPGRRAGRLSEDQKGRRYLGTEGHPGGWLNARSGYRHGAGLSVRPGSPFQWCKEVGGADAERFGALRPVRLRRYAWPYAPPSTEHRR